MTMAMPDPGPVRPSTTFHLEACGVGYGVTNGGPELCPVEEEGEVGHEDEIGGRGYQFDTVDGDADSEGEDIHAEADPEIQTPNIIPDPGNPTKEEIEKHRVSGHLPFRSWCKECVCGKAPGQPHRVAGVRRGEDHLIAFDYFYLGDPRNDEEGEQAVKYIVVKDKQSKARFAHAIPKKGVWGPRH